MRHLIYCIVFLFGIINVQAQDTIVKRSNEIILGKVIEVGDTEINFKRQNNLNGPIYVIEIADVLMIKYANGAKDIFNSPEQIPAPVKEKVQETPPEQPVQVIENKQQELSPNEETPEPPKLQQPFLKGQLDSQKYYKKYKAAAITTLLATALGPIELGGRVDVGLLKGLVVAIICSTKRPQPSKLDIPNTPYSENTEYKAGYRDGAFRKKRRKVWKNFLIPAGGWVIAYAIIAL